MMLHMAGRCQRGGHIHRCGHDALREMLKDYKLPTA